MRCKCGTGSDPVTGKMPVPQVSPLKGQHYSYHALINTVPPQCFIVEPRPELVDETIRVLLAKWVW
jgi:hypothetical protein